MLLMVSTTQSPQLDAGLFLGILNGGGGIEIFLFGGVNMHRALICIIKHEKTLKKTGKCCPPTGGECIPPTGGCKNITGWMLDIVSGIMNHAM